jgi:hypothetical protein
MSTSFAPNGLYELALPNTVPPFFQVDSRNRLVSPRAMRRTFPALAITFDSTGATH